MERRNTVLTAALTIALVLVFQIGMPKYAGTVAKASAPVIDPTPVTTNGTSPSTEPTPVVPNAPDVVAAPDIPSPPPPSIDTTPDWDGARYISSFGMPNTATYGQTITMTETATLTQFSFYMLLSPTAIFRGFVYAWDGTKATGAPLFAGGPRSTLRGINYEEVVFYIPAGIVLNAGQQYVLFASTSQDPGQPDNAGKWGSIGNDTTYSGGQFVYLNNGADPTKWTTTTWSHISQDLAFKAILARPTSIDTTQSWDRTMYISSFGMPNTATYGQTITMTGAATLTRFSFYMWNSPAAIFRGYVYAWDGTKATGSPLFASGRMYTSQGAVYEEVLFDIPWGIKLKAGQQYVLFASISEDPVQPPTAGKWGSIGNDTTYSGGQFVYLNNNIDPTKWTTTTWSHISQDLAFKVTLKWQNFLPLLIQP